MRIAIVEKYIHIIKKKSKENQLNRTNIKFYQNSNKSNIKKQILKKNFQIL